MALVLTEFALVQLVLQETLAAHALWVTPALVVTFVILAVVWKTALARDYAI
jgi:hypothetical protein